MRSSQVAAGDTATISQYNYLRDDARASSWLLPHQKSTPDLQLYVEPASMYVDSVLVFFAGGNSPTFTAPSTNPRIDVLSINSSGTLTRTAGTEAASPTAPSLPDGDLPICQVYNRVGQTTILDVDTAGQGYIYKDTRVFIGSNQKQNVVDLFTAICGTFTVTIASPAVFTCTGHGLVAGNKIRFTTTGSLPTGLAINTTYYVISSGLTSNAFQVSTTLGGSAVNTSGSQSGTHTCRQIWEKPSGTIKAIKSIVIGAGGNGGSGAGAGGGGGGAKSVEEFIPSAISSLVTITVAAGGTTTPSSFGSYLFAYNGANGTAGAPPNAGGGGGGTGGNGNGYLGGRPQASTTTGGDGYGGAGGNGAQSGTTSAGGGSEWGGGGGGNYNASPTNGGSSLHGAGGGGGAGATTQGGTIGTMVAGGGTNTSRSGTGLCGDGGNGSNTTGSAGGIPGGGGGGGTTTGGLGARGEVIIITVF